jgi:PII-like signaling protein
MKAPQDAALLRIFFGEKDRFQGQPLSTAIVAAAREAGLAGATVLRGIMGFGAESHLHSAKILRLSEDLPLVVEIVDQADKIHAFLPRLDGMMQEGMITLEKVKVWAYRSDTSDKTN